MRRRSSLERQGARSQPSKQRRYLSLVQHQSTAVRIQHCAHRVRDRLQRCSVSVRRDRFRGAS